MKQVTKIRIYSLAIMSLFFLCINSCKKDDTKTPVYYLPEVETNSVQDITSTSAKFSGMVISDGGALVESRGFKVSTNPSNSYTGELVYCGTGTGSFSGEIHGLISDTPYYVWAFATNTVGTEWGDRLSFNTGSSVNYDLNDVWDRGDIQITISGSSGLFTAINSGDWVICKNAGFISIGSEKLKNISSSGNLTWNCSELWYCINSGIAKEVYWVSNCTIIMAADGNSIVVGGTSPATTYCNSDTRYGTFTRLGKKMGKPSSTNIINDRH
jgi:hypothetical protein